MKKYCTCTAVELLSFSPPFPSQFQKLSGITNVNVKLTMESHVRYRSKTIFFISKTNRC